MGGVEKVEGSVPAGGLSPVRSLLSGVGVGVGDGVLEGEAEGVAEGEEE